MTLKTTDCEVICAKITQAYLKEQEITPNKELSEYIENTISHIGGKV